MTKSALLFYIITHRLCNVVLFCHKRGIQGSIECCYQCTQC